MYFLFVITILMNADRKPRSLFIYQINSRFHILYFGISGKGNDEGSEAIGSALSDIFPHMQGKLNNHYSWWSWDLDPQGKNRIPQNWGNDGAVWAKLGERDEDSIFATLCEVIMTIHEKLDTNLLR